MMEGRKVQFNNVSSVELIEMMGGDKQVCNSARVSFAGEHDTAALTQSDEGLIGFLLKNRHGTPFEAIVFTFRIHTFIAVAREWMRHRIGSFNEMSGRYVELPMEFFVPEKARVQKGKPGAYSYVPASEEVTREVQHILEVSYDSAARDYHELLAKGIAKEQARLVLPVGIYTTFYWTVNARSLMNFLELRLAPNAMQEINEAAWLVEAFFRDTCPVTSAAFALHGKAP